MITLVISLLLLSERQFFDESIHCLELESKCLPTEGDFKNDETVTPEVYYEPYRPQLYDPPNPFPEEENDVT